MKNKKSIRHQHRDLSLIKQRNRLWFSLPGFSRQHQFTAESESMNHFHILPPQKMQKDGFQYPGEIAKNGYAIWGGEKYTLLSP